MDSWKMLTYLNPSWLATGTTMTGCLCTYRRTEFPTIEETIPGKIQSRAEASARKVKFNGLLDLHLQFFVTVARSSKRIVNNGLVYGPSVVKFCYNTALSIKINKNKVSNFTIKLMDKPASISETKTR